MADWSSTGLPEFEIPGYSDTLKPNVIRSTQGYGPDKIRRRTTADVINIQGRIQIDTADTLVLDQFYDGNMTVPFTKTNPRTGVSNNYRFTSPPAYTNIGGDWWLATFGVEILP